VAVSEFTFWIEFTNRLNFIALDYLIYTSEVIGNIRESYPVGLIVSIILTSSLLIVWSARARIRHEPVTAMGSRRGIVTILIALVCSVILVGSANIEQMENDHNAYASELSGKWTVHIGSGGWS